MTKSLRLFLLVFISLALVDGSIFYAGQQQPQRQPGPGKKMVQTLFGPIEVDLSDPRPAISVGPPLPEPPPTAPAAAQPAPAPPTPQTAVQGDEIVQARLNYDNADLHQVFRTIADYLQLNYTIDPAVRGTVNVKTSGDIRRSDLLAILEAILKMNGATMVRSGNFYQVVPANTAARMPLQVQGAQAGANPDDQIILQVVRMQFVAADEMARLLNPYISESGNLVAQGSVLLITDRRSNLRKLLDLIDVFDARAFQGERVRLFQVKNNRVKDIVDDLKTVFSGYALSTNSAIRFLGIDRMNSLLVVTGNPDVFPEVERWLDRLDQPLQSAGMRNYVYRAKNAKATDIQKVLTELYSEQTTMTVVQQRTGTIAAPGNLPPANVPAPLTNAPAPGPVAGAQNQTAEIAETARLSGQIRIVADPVNNALIIQASPQDYQAIERTIEQLDILPKQVLIDVQVYEVVLDHSLSLGLSAILQNRGTLANPQTTASFVAPAGGGPASLAATTFAFIGRTRELVAFLNASENRSRVRTVSAPSILASNNATAAVTVGTEVPVPTTSSASGAQQNGSTLFAQTIQFRETGVILSVTPQINEGGKVTMLISQEVSQASQNTTSSLSSAPVIGKSAVRSTIVIQDGETIPLTGFIRESDSLTRNRVPLLGSLPVAGLLFGNSSKSNTRAELIILITPHVLATTDESAAAAEELKNKLKEVKKLLN
jgi:general secretion pathway protein D